MFLTKREGVAFVLDAVESALAPSAGARVHRGRRVRAARPMRAATRCAWPRRTGWPRRRGGAARIASLLVDIGTTTDRHHPDRRRACRRRRGAPIPIGWRRASWFTPARSGRRSRRWRADVCVQGRATALSAEGFASRPTCTCGAATSARRRDRRDRRRPARDARVRRRSPRARAVRRSRDDGRDGDHGDRRRAGRGAGRARGRGDRARRRAASVDSAGVVAGAGCVHRRAGRARRAGSRWSRWRMRMATSASRCAPAAAVGLLLEERLAAVESWSRLAAAAGARGGATRGARAAATARRPARSSCLAADRLPTRCATPTAAAPCDDDAAHWMAVLAMDQYAELLAAPTARVRRVVTSCAGKARGARGRTRAGAGAVALAARGRSAAALVGRDERQHCGVGGRSGGRHALDAREAPGRDRRS